MLDNIIVVLYEPQDAVNIGGTARAMSNFGLRRLRLVNPAPFDPGRLHGIAHQADAILADLAVYADLVAALADCGLVVATSGRPRRPPRPRQAPRDAAPALLAAASPEAPVAILFGREDSGLPGSALALAHTLITIPTDPHNHSLNLAQAVLVVAYEVWLATRAREAPAASAGASLARGMEREEMFGALETLLRTRGGVPAGRVAYELDILRALLLRALPRPDEAARLTHLFRRLAAPGPPPDPDTEPGPS